MDQKNSIHVVIFGGGIAGLTTAHELVTRGFKVTLYEQDQIIGGMARSRREVNSIPSEHSWRGYAPFYSNTFDIIKRIPLDSNSSKTVYDNLSKPIQFYVTRDQVAPYRSKLSWADYLVIGYLLLKYLCAGDRREEYFKTRLTQILKPKLSADGYRYMVDFICGPGYGMEKKDASYAHYFKPVSIYVLASPEYNQTHKYPNLYKTRANERWHVMNKPTSEAWFDPWEKFLKAQGVQIIKGIGLDYIQISRMGQTNGCDKITACVNTDGTTITADEYVCCINPFVTEKIFAKSGLKNLEKTFNQINSRTDSRQVAFRLGFEKKIKFPEPNIAFIFPDSEFNITLYPQEQSWESTIVLDSKGKLQSLWSGTILELYAKSKLFGTQGFNLTKDQLIQEIIHQIIRSASLQKLLKEANGPDFILTEKDIVYREIWYEWDIDPHTSQLNQSNKKWVTNVYNQKARPQASTQISNLYLGGSHISTSMEVWSMEGAVESGKMVANEILSKHGLEKTWIKTHRDPEWTKLFKLLDNGLYSLGLPNIVDLIIFIGFIGLIYWLIYKKNLTKV
jgi:hypothetical protein